jgi:hypothetical protein
MAVLTLTELKQQVDDDYARIKERSVDYVAVHRTAADPGGAQWSLMCAGIPKGSAASLAISMEQRLRSIRQAAQDYERALRELTGTLDAIEMSLKRAAGATSSGFRID